MKIEFGTTEIAEMPASQTDASRKSGWLAVLVVLFLISYALMTMLIVEQGRTIDSQRALIHELYRDSTELSALRLKTQQEQSQQEQAQAQSQSAIEQDPSSQIATQTPLSQAPSKAAPLHRTPSARTPSTQTPSTLTPSTQAPAKQTPSTQANQQRHAQSEAAKQKPFRMPSKPASDLVDADRALNLI